MATINIGSLSLSSHKGDYDNSTSYVKNDVVYYATTGSAYIAKQATTGNLPTSTAHWNVFAAGSGGIWNAGLSLGTAGQVVKVNSGATALEFGADTGGKILKIYNHTVSSNISTNSTSYQDTGLTITLTPSSASNDFLILADLGVTRHASTSASMFVQIMRDSTAVVAHGNGYMGYNATSNDRGYYPMFLHHLDVPNSTSSITYKVQYKSESSGHSVHSYGSRRMTIFEIDGGIE